ncbi:hypothetical protein [Maridesulfovibrio frigidus]|uniref:hypothetical protein n=1 Tax=Maridesulfovibrio frigidus TaxID=340956 RepID=UPI000A040477|nr:hypothetical protein [Maridesulfovibrio frigidus]
MNIHSIKHLVGFGFKEIQHGYAIWLLALTPIIFFSIGAQIVLDRNGLTTLSHLPSQYGESGNVINYLTFSFTHLIACTVIIISSIKRCYSTVTKEKQLLIKCNATFSSVFVCLLFCVVISFFSSNIEYLSHQIVYTQLENIPEFGFLFHKIIFENTLFSFRCFSLLPVTLICFGLLAVGFTTYELAIHTSRLMKIKNLEQWNNSFEMIFNDFKGCFLKHIILLATSSIATSLYFLIPVEAGTDFNHAYFSYAKSMSIFWGALFTLTLVAILIWPHRCYCKVLECVRRDVHTYDINTATKFELCCSMSAILKQNFQYSLSVFLPIFVSLLGPLLT